MEIGGNMFIREETGNSNNNNSTNHAWESMWALNNHSRFDLGNSSSLYATAEITNTTHISEGNAAHALMFPHSQSLYTGDGSNLHPDPHLMCLKLGKRHYFEDATATSIGEGDRGFSMVKKGKPYYTFASAGGGGVGPSSSSPVLVTSTATVPRCQVEGCHVPLINAKDYHRRHKVCEVHSKAPKVMVLGLEQRFCQQCSRFHVVSEFDDSKRSCRRRLAGHNERRRKSSHDSLSRNSSQANELMTGRFPFPSPTGRALSLLSSKAESWVSSSDLSSRCSAALRELIAENRAAIVARHLILDSRDWHLHLANEGETQMVSSNSMTSSHQYQMLAEQHNWGRYQQTNTHVTLDLMQAPTEHLGFLSVRGRTKNEEEEECSEIWGSLESGHLV